MLEYRSTKQYNEGSSYTVAGAFFLRYSLVTLLMDKKIYFVVKQGNGYKLAVWGLAPNGNRIKILENNYTEAQLESEFSEEEFDELRELIQKLDHNGILRYVI